MATHRYTRILAGEFVVVGLAAPTVAATLATAGTLTVVACPAGESEDIYTNTCLSDLAASCVGLAEDQQAQWPQLAPRSSVSSSP